MIEDTSGQNHFRIYGKSDKINAVGNRNNEFQDGYATGAETLDCDANKVIEEEEQLRREVGDDLGSGFAEWTRGFWAARSQMVAAGIEKRPKRR